MTRISLDKSTVSAVSERLEVGWGGGGDARKGTDSFRFGSTWGDGWGSDYGDGKGDGICSGYGSSAGDGTIPPVSLTEEGLEILS